MKRRYFLLGTLCGCLLGVGATIVWRHAAGWPRSLSAPVTPTWIFTNSPADQLPPGVPPNAQRREINGQPYYIIPLAMQEKR
jgi:hypothetical protein